MTRTIDLQRRDLDRLLNFYDAQRDLVAEQEGGFVRVIPTCFTAAALEKFATKGARGGYFYRGYELTPQPPVPKRRG